MPKISSHIVRLIGGELRRRQISFPTATGLRPTPVRVRETLFNWLGQDLTGKNCLDLFAGSGALGFEAASRHAEYVVMIENTLSVFTHLKQTQARLSLQAITELRHQSAIDYLTQTQSSFDIMFLDPPFASNLLYQTLLLAMTRLKPNGVLYVEAAHLPVLSQGKWLRKGKAGNVYFGLITLS